VPLSNFVPRGFRFVHHSIAILYHEVPNPNNTIRNFFIAACRAPSTHHAHRPPSSTGSFQDCAANKTDMIQWIDDFFQHPKCAVAPTGTKGTSCESAVDFHCHNVSTGAQGPAESRTIGVI
jgi:hypothetical protein